MVDQDEVESPWVSGLISHGLGELALDELMEMADQSEKPWVQRGEACFHAAVLAIENGQKSQAKSLLDRSYRSFDGALGYTFHAKAILERMESGESWPSWLGT